MNIRLDQSLLDRADNDDLKDFVGEHTGRLEKRAGVLRYAVILGMRALEEQMRTSKKRR